MTSRALELAKQQFSLTAIVEKHAALYADLLGEVPSFQTWPRRKLLPADPSVPPTADGLATARAGVRHDGLVHWGKETAR